MSMHVVTIGDTQCTRQQLYAWIGCSTSSRTEQRRAEARPLVFFVLQRIKQFLKVPRHLFQKRELTLDQVKCLLRDCKRLLSPVVDAGKIRRCGRARHFRIRRRPTAPVSVKLVQYPSRFFPLSKLPVPVHGTLHLIPAVGTPYAKTRPFLGLA